MTTQWNVVFSEEASLLLPLIGLHARMNLFTALDAEIVVSN